MKIFRKIATRLNVTILLLVLQMAAIAVLAAVVVQNPIVYYIGVFVSVLVFSFVLKKDEASVYKLTWIIVILAVLPVGGVLYLFFGNKRPIKKIAAHMEEHAVIAKLLDADGHLPFINQVQCGRMASLMQYIRRVSSFHAYKNTETKYYPLGKPMFEDMLEACKHAEKFIFLEYFIIKRGEMWDTLLEVLEQKASEGVDVRLIVDDMGSNRLFSQAYVHTLREKNIKVLRFNPMVPLLLLFMNNGDHRKILVVDGKEAFTGGINISDEYINLTRPFGLWKDTGLRLRGDAVWSFTLMFIEMWDTFCRGEERITDYESYKAETHHVKTDGFVLPYGDSPLDAETLGENIYIDILTQAEHYVYIFTPYLIISEKLIAALQLATKRGVDVRVVTPGIADKKLVNRLTRSYYRHLLEAGVKIYEYTPGFLHAKCMVSDDINAVVGTINMDYRSLYLHFECAVLLYNSGTVKEIRDDVFQAISESRQVENKPTKWRLGTDLLDAVLHLFAPLM